MKYPNNIVCKYVLPILVQRFRDVNKDATVSNSSKNNIDIKIIHVVVSLYWGQFAKIRIGNAFAVSCFLFSSKSTLGKALGNAIEAIR